jgi:hypothetical protein
MTRLSVMLMVLLAVGCAHRTPPPPTPAALAFPSLSEVPLPPGRYWCTPPFGIDFVFDVIGEDWESAHLHAEFFDIMQLEEGSRSPRRWIAWALPTTLYGATDASAAGLSPGEAAELLASNPFVVASQTSRFQLSGRDGYRLDLSASRATPPVPIFGGPDGDFGLDNEHELRLGIVRDNEKLVLALVIAPNGELEAAWTEAEPILASVDF